MNTFIEIEHTCDYNGETNSTKKIVQDIVEINHILNNYLVEWKNKINDNKSWDIAKRLSNTYEFIFSSGYNKINVSKKRPLSRSYFKLWEILHDFPFLLDIQELKTAHIAEGPGGFIECICDYNNKYDKSGEIYGITLKSNQKKIPSWKLPKWLIQKQNIHLYDSDDGNIYNIHTIDMFVEYVGESSCNFITCDGGFDYSADFNNQETDSILLMLSEIYTSLRIQKDSGHMILKIFDIFSLRTIKLISMCAQFYKSYNILKPMTSRPANSEKYILFMNKQTSNPIFEKENIQSMRHAIVYRDASLLDRYDRYINDIISITKYNILYTSNQIKSLKETLNLSKDMNRIKKKCIDSNINICKEWCRRYKIDT